MKLKFSLLIVFSLVFFTSSTLQAQAAAYQMTNIIGQRTGSDPNWSGTTANNGNGTSGTITAEGLRNPHGIDIDTIHHRLFVADRDNNRVLIFNLDSTNNMVDFTADNVLGQANFSSGTANRGGSVAANTLNQPWNLAYDSERNYLYVGDLNSNRVLIYDVTSITDGEDAINVLGQANFTSSGAATTINGLRSPLGLAVDTVNDRLFVADANNARVIAYSIASITDGEDAINVLGQPDFVTAVSSRSISRLTLTRGLAYDPERELLFVSEQANKRVMVFDVNSITNGEDAQYVIGQIDFTSAVAATGTQGVADAYLGMDYDPDSKTFISTDSLNHRVLLYDFTNPGTYPAAFAVIGQSSFTTFQTASTDEHAKVGQPRGIAIDTTNGHRRLYVVGALENRIGIFDLPTDLPTSINSMTEDEAFTQSIAVTNTQGTVSYSLLSTTSPDIDNLSPAGGTLSGTPHVPGTFTVAIKASDSGDWGEMRSTKTYSVAVAAKPVSSTQGSRDFRIVQREREETASVSTSVPSSPVLPTSAFKFLRNLKKGMTHPDVKELQKYLNANGVIVAVSGAGSPGKESTYFGNATYAAVKKFQEKYRSEILVPLNLTNPTGNFAEYTRKKVNGY